MLFTNTTNHTIVLDAVGLDPVPPNGDCLVPLTLAAPIRADNGQRGASPIEQVAPQLQPKDPAELKEWKKVPPMATPVSRVVTLSKRDPSEPPGVRALREAQEALKTSQKALVSPQTAPK